MNSYGEPQSPRARARVPGAGASAPDDDRHPGGARSAPDSYRRGSAGRASVGSASVGSASVGSASPGRASVGSASPGRASVGSASVGSASVGSASVGGTTGSARVGGRASVGSASVGAGTASVGGRAAVARAAVRPGGSSDFGAPEPAGGGRGGKVKDKSKAAKRRRRTNILTASAAVLVILLGAGVVGGTYFFDSVTLPQAKSEDQANVILYNNGATLAKTGEQNRSVVPEDKINPYVKNAVIAAEDKNFRSHHGIDMKGIVRAAWNNFTGGATQGASTITQQYARHIADLKAISINRKLREAVIARKLESTYNKDQILGMYLNFVDLGEGRYGIEAAAQGYFGKSVTTPVGAKNAITPYEAAVLASIIKQPYPDKFSQGFDPNYNLEGAKVRWLYTLQNMLELGAITQEQFDKRQYPKVKPKGAATCKTCAADKPVGMIIRHVNAELASMGLSQAQIAQGGMTIKTTIDPAVQKAAEDAGSRKSDTSRMRLLPKTYQAAVIGIDPTNGRVLGYYGGDNPNGTDYAGYMKGNSSDIDGGQSPGSSFKIYTLAAGLKENLSFDSIWDGTLPRTNGQPISNAGQDPGRTCDGNIKGCDLETATIRSYNFPFYWIAEKIGREKVIEAARAAGIKHMYTDSNSKFPNGIQVDLEHTDKSTWLKKGYFDNEVGFGQYRVVPLEHAEGVATIVNGGVHHTAHFIEQVKIVNPVTGKTTNLNPEKVDGNRVFDSAQMSNLDGVLAKIVKRDDRDLRGGRESIAKSGTWELGEGSGDCWFVGGIPQLAATVWVGGAKNRVLLKEPGGNRDMFGAGTPSLIWQQFLNASTKALDMKKEDFPERQITGDPNLLGNGVKQEVKPPDTSNNCAAALLGLPCNNDDNNGGNGAGNNNGDNNNGGNNNGNNDNNGNGNGNGTNGRNTRFPLPGVTTAGT